MDAGIEPVVPQYGAGCLDGVVPAILGRTANDWLPEPVRRADQVVLLVLDGLGWQQLQSRAEIAPTLSAMPQCAQSPSSQFCALQHTAPSALLASASLPSVIDKSRVPSAAVSRRMSR